MEGARAVLYPSLLRRQKLRVWWLGRCYLRQVGGKGRTNGVLATAVFAAVITSSTMAVRGVECSMMSSQLTLVNSEENRVSTSCFYFSPAVCHLAGVGVGPEVAADA